MLAANTSMHHIPDDPMRTAPPWQAPGEIEPPEPRELSPAQLRTLTAETEADVLACLKGEKDFMAFDQRGCINSWTPYELWVVLTNDMKENEIARTLACVLGCYAWKENDDILSFKWHIEREIIDPFVAEQVKWRAEFAPDEAAGEWE